MKGTVDVLTRVVLGNNTPSVFRKTKAGDMSYLGNTTIKY